MSADFPTWDAALFGGLYALIAVIAPFIAWRRGLVTTDGRRIWPRSSPEEFSFYLLLITATLAGLSFLYFIDSRFKSPAMMATLSCYWYFMAMYHRRHPWKSQNNIVTNGSLIGAKLFAGMSLIGALIEALPRQH